MTAHQKQVIELRQSGLTYAAIGQRLGISRQRAHQLERAAPAWSKIVELI